MDSIFMSYRRMGTSGYGGRLHMDLRGHFGTSRVFRDIDSIPPGTDFYEVIEQAVARSGVVIALIGREWLTVTDADGNRRLDDPDDFVRLELESAFRHGTVVIPVLVEEARMPPSTALPPSLVKLSRVQGIELSDERWEYDVSRLIARLDEIVGGGPSSATDSPELPAPTASDPARAADPIETDPPTTVITRIPRNVIDVEDPPDPPATPPRRRVGVLLAAVVSTLVVLAAVIAATQGGGPSLRPVPRVVGQDVAAASAVLRAAGFAVSTEDLVDDDKPVSAVVRQEPADGEKIKEGALVRLVIAKNSGKVAVPRIVELKRPEAEAALQAAGLTWTFDEVTSDTAESGVVVTQSPEPSTKVEKGSSVTAAVSTGPPTTVPLRTVTTNATVPRPSSSGAAPATTPATSAPSATVATTPVTTVPRTTVTFPAPTSPPTSIFKATTTVP